MPSRRGFLAGLAAASFAPSATWAEIGHPAALSAAMDAAGRYVLVGLKRDGAIAFSVPIPDRGHAAAAHPELAEAVAIARRPGSFAKVIDCAAGLIMQTLTAPPGRHFYGHGAFSADGTLLFTPENDIATGAGRVGVWDRGVGYARIDEFASGGIGPHEILRLPSGALAVANGGIRTHPDTGREKLNLDTMRPNLSVFTPEGALADQAEPAAEDHQNSLRHIAAAPDGRVVCGFQWQGDPFAAPSLVGLYSGDGRLAPTEIDPAIQRRLDGYIGSVCAFDGGRAFAASSPRGGVAMVFGQDGSLAAHHNMTDVCGLAALRAGDALATDGVGRVMRLTSTGAQRLAEHALAFDNHLVPLG
ncbi:MAG: DUF1513 domain-containing protein [Pseudomonadota bacterium]